MVAFENRKVPEKEAAEAWWNLEEIEWPVRIAMQLPPPNLRFISFCSQFDRFNRLRVTNIHPWTKGDGQKGERERWRGVRLRAPWLFAKSVWWIGLIVLFPAKPFIPLEFTDVDKVSTSPCKAYAIPPN